MCMYRRETTRERERETRAAQIADVRLSQHTNEVRDTSTSHTKVPRNYTIFVRLLPPREQVLARVETLVASRKEGRAAADA